MGSISVGGIVIVVVVEEDTVCERGETVEEALNRHLHGGVVREGGKEAAVLGFTLVIDSKESISQCVGVREVLKYQARTEMWEPGWGTLHFVKWLLFSSK